MSQTCLCSWIRSSDISINQSSLISGQDWRSGSLCTSLSLRTRVKVRAEEKWEFARRNTCNARHVQCTTCSAALRLYSSSDCLLTTSVACLSRLDLLSAVSCLNPPAFPFAPGQSLLNKNTQCASIALKLARRKTNADLVNA